MLDLANHAHDNYPIHLLKLGVRQMKKLVLGAAFALAASTAMAGSVAEPVLDQEIIIEQAPASSVNHHILPPLFFVLFVGGAVLL
ncbi:hypothetical protein GCM10011358_01540 [Sinisalibacter lacisalsi]|uniref:Uncharacterized protein n=2 Tax=Sinisalibacter lacisalsi TaxID=1526570 RepID=A0ABQ1QC97_9RHOB|nr:hypothetical protein GCM10011358_01540 [Sinisalibacter lacisalsi]